jgi:DNA-binding SARP family transcriptional activator
MVPESAPARGHQAAWPGLPGDNGQDGRREGGASAGRYPGAAGGPRRRRDPAARRGARLRALLIRLAIADGRAVSVERLAEDLWDGQGPADAANAVQALVSRLRGAVGRNTVEFGPAGCRLLVDPDDVDARAFERRVAAGRLALAGGRLAEAASSLAEALAQSRGPALADVADAAFAAAAITRLSELRLAALEDRIDAEVVDLVAALVDKSLVMAVGEHEVRYQLLETVRAYAAGRLAEAGEEHRARAAHAEFFLALAERAEPELCSSDQLVWLHRMTAEHGNFSAALRHVIAAGDAASALRFVGALAWFWITRDYDAEAAEWAAAVAQIAGDAPPPGLHDAWAICQLVVLVGQWQQHPPPAASMRDFAGRVTALASGASHPLLLAAPMVSVLGGDSQEARHRLRVMGERSDPWLRAASEVFGGHLALNDGHIEEAAAGLAAGYAAFGEVGDRWGMIMSLTGLASVELARAAPAEAIRLLNEARGHASEGLAGNFGEMISISLGRALALAGEFDAARAELEHGIEAAERIGERDDHAHGYLELCDLARRQGDLGRAHQQLDHALKIVDPHARRPDMTGMAAMAYSRAGCLAEQEGNLVEAARWHAKALALLAEGGAILLPSNPVLATVVEGLAALAAARGDYTAAAERLGLADALHGFRDAGSLELARAETAARAWVFPATLPPNTYRNSTRNTAGIKITSSSFSGVCRICITLRQATVKGLSQRLGRADPGSQLAARAGPGACRGDSRGLVSRLRHAALPVCSSPSSCAA